MQAANYEPPIVARGRPAVIAWFRVYCGTMVLLYGSLFALWEIFETETFGVSGTVVAILALSIAVAAFYIVAMLVPYKPWGWTVGLIAICLGFSTIMILPGLGLLYYWMKPTTKGAFGRL